MTIKIRYRAVDGYSASRSFKTLGGARRYAIDRVGAHADLGTGYAVSADGVGTIYVTGCTLDELFGVEPQLTGQEQYDEDGERLSVYGPKDTTSWRGSYPDNDTDCPF